MVLLWLIIISAAALLILRLVVGAGPADDNKAKCYQQLLLTPPDEALLNSVFLNRERAQKWGKLVEAGERYQTPSGQNRLRLINLDGEDLDLLIHVSWKAAKAAESDRDDARMGHLQDRLEDLRATFDAKWRWWVEMTEEDRREERRMGQSWKSYVQ